MLKESIRKYSNKVKQAMFSNYYENIAPNPVELDNIPGNNILVIAPHPDDEIIGLGGTLIKINKSEDKNIYMLYAFSREEERCIEAKTVCDKLKVNCIIAEDFKSQLNSILIRNSLRIKFDTIIIPHLLDNHKDHYKVCSALWSCLLRSDDDFRIVMYEVWSLLLPNIIINITDVIEAKFNLLKLYKSQLESKDYLHAIRGLNAYRSLLLPGLKQNSYAEALVMFHNKEEYLELFQMTFDI